MILRDQEKSWRENKNQPSVKEKQFVPCGVFKYCFLFCRIVFSKTYEKVTVF